MSSSRCASKRFCEKEPLKTRLLDDRRTTGIHCASLNHNPLLKGLLSLPRPSLFSSHSAKRSLIPARTIVSSYLPMTQKISPATIGGYGRQAGEHGGLGSVGYSTRCPPEIQRDSRIIAVCGVNDYENASSPSEDGWFHSDFYLFNHLFAGTGKYHSSVYSLDYTTLC